MKPSTAYCAGKDARFGVDNVGTPAASLTAFLAAQAFQPDLAISLGTAGGFKTKGAAIGSVFVGTATVNHDRRIPLPVRTTHLLYMQHTGTSQDCMVSPESCTPLLSMRTSRLILMLILFRIRIATFNHTRPTSRPMCGVSYQSICYGGPILSPWDHHKAHENRCQATQAQASMCLHSERPLVSSKLSS